MISRKRYFHNAWTPTTRQDVIILFGGKGPTDESPEENAEIVHKGTREMRGT